MSLLFILPKFSGNCQPIVYLCNKYSYVSLLFFSRKFSGKVSTISLSAYQILIIITPLGGLFWQMSVPRILRKLPTNGIKCWYLNFIIYFAIVLRKVPLPIVYLSNKMLICVFVICESSQESAYQSGKVLRKSVCY